MTKLFPFIFILLISICCQKKSELEADVIYINGSIYTVDDSNPTAEAVAIKADSFIYVGNRAGVDAFVGEETKTIDLKGKTMIPGLVEGHAHIFGVGYNLLNVDLRQATSYQEVVDLIAARAADTPEGTWIMGGGWHQEKWKVQPELTNGFPSHDLLSEAVPNHPVYLRHVSNHAALANAKAMEVAGINGDTPQPEGGEIFMNLNGEPTGIFNETAQGLIAGVIPEATKERDTRALQMALNQCFKEGITGFHQAGSGFRHIDLYKEFAEKGALKLRMYVMLNGRDQKLLDTYFENGIEENLYDNRLTVRAVKLYADGALGSRGAWLLEEYTDAPGIHGHNVVPMSKIEAIVEKGRKAGFQLCVHAIGDRANREVLDIYERVLTNDPRGVSADHRFRIEHAQHFHPDDIPRFAEMGVVPAMQAIHMSSDRPWAIDRLGRKRIRWGAYMWQSLLQTGTPIVNGSDAPVEPLNPIAGFYASVTRKTLNGTPEDGYEPAEKMTREQALRSFTLDAAFGAFQENKKGSIEVGKWADLTILDQDIMTIPEEDILKTKVQMTVIGGEIVYEAE